MKVVLPIAALLAILIAAAVSGGAKPNDRAPVDQAAAAPAALHGAPAPVAAAYPVAFDPFTGWGVGDLQDGATDPGPEAPALALPLVEVDPFDRYGVAAQPVPLVHAVTDPWDWQPFAETRARYALADALPAAGAGPVVTDPWWLTAPLDAK